MTRDRHGSVGSLFFSPRNVTPLRRQRGTRNQPRPPSTPAPNTRAGGRTWLAARPIRPTVSGTVKGSIHCRSIYSEWNRTTVRLLSNLRRSSHLSAGVANVEWDSPFDLSGCLEGAQPTRTSDGNVEWESRMWRALRQASRLANTRVLEQSGDRTELERDWPVSFGFLLTPTHVPRDHWFSAKIYIYIYICFYISLSLSLYIYIYIYIINIADIPAQVTRLCMTSK